MRYNLTPSPACYPFNMIYFCNGVVGTASETLVHNVTIIRQLCHGDTIIMSNKHDKQSQSLADVNVSPLKAHVALHDCSIFCILKCKHLEC